MFRRLLLTVAILVALGALGLTAKWVLGSFRKKGDIPIRPAEKVGMKFSVNETLSFGEAEDRRTWASDYVDEVLEVTDGKPTKVRRSVISALNGTGGVPKPAPLKVDLLLDGGEIRDEKSGVAFKDVPVIWPDPHYGLLPDRPVFHSSQWDVSPAAAAAAARFLSHGTVTAGRGTGKLEPEVVRDGIACWRLRIAIQGDMEDGSLLSAWADIFIEKKTSLMLDIDWAGKIDGNKGIVQFQFVRQRRAK